MVEWILSIDRTTQHTAGRQAGHFRRDGDRIRGPGLFLDLRKPNPGIWYHNMLWAQLGSASGLSSPNYWWSEHLRQIDRNRIARPFFVRQ
jgi:hypothetical protein